MRIGIAGAGVSALTCGVRLLEARAASRVTLYARELPGATTSAVAGAIWFPYRSGPIERATPWSRVSYTRLEQMAQRGEGGVEMVEMTMLYPEPLTGEPWWLEAVPGDIVRAARPDELPDGYGDGRCLHVPFMYARGYVEWLSERFAELGGRIEERTLDALTDVEGDLVVNCSGVGAGALDGDPEIVPVRGQIAYVRCPEPLRHVIDETGPNALAYVLPRADVVVLGGTAEEGDTHPEPREETTRSILERTKRLQPALEHATYVGSAVGFRPARPTVRLDRETLADGRTVVHDYGHGGSGFTLSWGCAEEVLELVSAGAPTA